KGRRARLPAPVESRWCEPGHPQTRSAVGTVLRSRRPSPCRRDVPRGYLLSKGLDLARWPACLQPVPGGNQFRLMNLGPCFHESALPLGKAAADELDRIDGEDANIILIVRVEVRSMVGRRRLGKHANDDPEESGDLWHRLPRM